MVGLRLGIMGVTILVVVEADEAKGKRERGDGVCFWDLRGLLV